MSKGITFGDDTVNCISVGNYIGKLKKGDHNFAEALVLAYYVSKTGMYFDVISENMMKNIDKESLMKYIEESLKSSLENENVWWNKTNNP